MMVDELEECPVCGSENLEEEDYGYICLTCGEVIELEAEENWSNEEGVIDEL